MKAEHETRPRPCFVAGSKRLLIGGQWVEGSSGRVIDPLNPATGEVIARMTDGSAQDIDRAVKATRAAFEGEWSRWTPYGRRGACQTSDVDRIAFTGSVEIGRKIVTASTGNLRRIPLEPGGKSPDIVSADANLDTAGPGAASRTNSSSG